MENRIQAPAQWQTVATLLWGCLIFAITTGTQLGAMLVWLRYDGRPISDIASVVYNGNAITVALAGSLVATVAAIYVVIKLKKDSDVAHYLAINSLPLNEIPKWVLGLTLMLGISTAISYINPGSQSEAFMVSIYESANPKYLLFIAAVLMAPVAEELLFRGFLFRGLQHGFLGVFGTVVFTSACWAMIHLQYEPLYIGVIFVIGLFLGFARYKSNSILLPIFLHMLYNVIAMLGTAFSS